MKRLFFSLLHYRARRMPEITAASFYQDKAKNLKDMQQEFFFALNGETSKMYIRVQKRMYFEGHRN